MEELWRNLNGWESYVSADDLQTLQKAGVEKWMLDDAFRALRYKNETFGPLDQGMRGESIQAHMAPGDQYRLQFLK